MLSQKIVRVVTIFGLMGTAAFAHEPGDTKSSVAANQKFRVDLLSSLKAAGIDPSQYRPPGKVSLVDTLKAAGLYSNTPQNDAQDFKDFEADMRKWDKDHGVRYSFETDSSRANPRARDQGESQILRNLVENSDCHWLPGATVSKHNDPCNSSNAQFQINGKVSCTTHRLGVDYLLHVRCDSVVEHPGVKNCIKTHEQVVSSNVTGAGLPSVRAIDQADGIAR